MALLHGHLMADSTAARRAVSTQRKSSMASSAVGSTSANARGEPAQCAAAAAQERAGAAPPTSATELHALRPRKLQPTHDPRAGTRTMQLSPLTRSKPSMSASVKSVALSSASATRAFASQGYLQFHRTTNRSVHLNT